MKRRGFTLIEMLVATALSALLIGAVLMIAARLSNDRAALSTLEPTDVPGLRTLLEWDLRNADQVESINANRIDIVGHNAIDPSTLEPTFRAVAVTYELQPGTHDLIRRQRLLDDPAAAVDWHCVIAARVSQISYSELNATRATMNLSVDGSTIEATCDR